jgi:hypothetical protein
MPWSSFAPPTLRLHLGVSRTCSSPIDAQVTSTRMAFPLSWSLQKRSLGSQPLGSLQTRLDPGSLSGWCVVFGLVQSKCSWVLPSVQLECKTEVLSQTYNLFLRGALTLLSQSNTYDCTQDKFSLIVEEFETLRSSTALSVQSPGALWFPLFWLFNRVLMSQ